MSNLLTCLRCEYGVQRGTGIPRSGIGLPCLADKNQRSFGSLAKAGRCPLGKFTDPDGSTAGHSSLRGVTAPSSPQTKRAVPSPLLPLAARIISKMAIPTDAGVGDTLARLIGSAGGEPYKRWFRKITGRDCGCTNRQAWLNARFPYQSRNIPVTFGQRNVNPDAVTEDR